MPTTTETRPAKWQIRTLEAWHGLFAGSYLVAFWTWEGTLGLHMMAGYVTMGLLVVRLTAAAVAPPNTPFALPLANPLRITALFKATALGRRSPLVLLSGLLVLIIAPLIILTGVLATAGGEGELHSVVANLSLLLVIVHVGLVITSRLVKQ